jgi:hypothetical protein
MTDDNVDQNLDELVEDELTVLKERAVLMGIKHHPTIGVDALRAKIADHMAGVKPEPESVVIQLSEAQQINAERVRLKRECS